MNTQLPSGLDMKIFALSFYLRPAFTVCARSEGSGKPALPRIGLPKHSMLSEVPNFREKDRLSIRLRISTPGRRQSKTIVTIDERGSKIARNIFFDCYLSPVWRQMAIENSVYDDF